MAPTHGRALRVIEFCALAVLLALVGLYAFHPIFSVDFHWHVKLGEVIRSRGQIPDTDLFSAVDPDRPHVQFQWLWDVIASFLYSAGGACAIRWMQVVVQVGAVGGLYFVVRRALTRDGSRLDIAIAFSLAISAFALVLFEDRFRARPAALTLAFTVAMLPVLLGGFRNPTRATWLWVFGLGLLWSNLHGGASLLLPLSMGALAAGSLLTNQLWPERQEPAAHAVGLLGASLIALALSPTLVAGMLDWLQAVQPQIEGGNEEWQPSYSMLQHGLAPSFLLVGLGPSMVALLYVVEQVRRVRAGGRAAIDLGEWFLCGGYLMLAHHAVRNTFLCVVPAVFMLRRYALARSEAKTEPQATESARRRVVGAGVAAVLLVGASFYDAVIDGYGGLERVSEILPLDLSPGAFPEQAADFIAEAGLEGGILNDGRWGGYLIAHTWPACGVFVDTRHHLTEQMWPLFRQSHRPLERHLAVQAAFERFGTELVVFRSPTFALLLPPPGLQLLYKAGDQEVYQHLGGAHAQQNLARAGRWLAAHGAGAVTHGDLQHLAMAAVNVGRTQWMAAPYQEQRLARAVKQARSTDDLVAAEAERSLGILWFTAGSYERALEHLARALDLRPGDERARYYRALSRLARGDLEAARGEVALLARSGARTLSPAARGRLAVLSKYLTPAAAAPEGSDGTAQ